MVSTALQSLGLLLLLACGSHGFVQPRPSSLTKTLALQADLNDSNSIIEEQGRRQAMVSLATGVTGALLTSLMPQTAWASGGATAGKYTTIPIAKRRYYGRVQQAVHDFLLMAPEIAKTGDTTGKNVQFFFDTNGVIVVAARRQDISGQCTKKGGTCQGQEIRDSRWNDMKTSMYLLGNAFRTNQQKPPDNLPTVKAAKAFFKEIDALEKRVTTKPKASDPKAAELYLSALNILEEYLDLVELPPTTSGHYDQEFDTLVGEAARIT